ncbi:type II secretion system protein GspM [Thioalkalivibrio sp. ALE9]|uniref:type II secretion system protein GspM n=1 Tax=Thioalkalivibrio sp. ALE9 TaxID=1158169 RepID=UPI000368E6AA|nr:type II secretion system protein GspM [Thioalkalivibrio sp. ALE9]
MNRLEQLQPRERRILAVGILASLILIALLGVVVPVVQKLASSAESVADAGFRLERVQDAAAQLPAVEAEVSALERALDQQGLTQRESSESLATAALQERVAAIIADHDGNVQSTRVQAASDEDGLQRIGVRVQFEAGSESLAGILQAIDRARPLLFVEQLSVRASREFDRQRRADYRGKTDVTLELSAYWRPEQS